MESWPLPELRDWIVAGVLHLVMGQGIDWNYIVVIFEALQEGFRSRGMKGMEKNLIPMPNQCTVEFRLFSESTSPVTFLRWVSFSENSFQSRGCENSFTPCFQLLLFGAP